MGDVIDMQPFREKRDRDRTREIKRQFMGWSFRGDPVYIQMPPLRLSCPDELIRKWADQIKKEHEKIFLKDKPIEP